MSSGIIHVPEVVMGGTQPDTSVALANPAIPPEHARKIQGTLHRAQMIQQMGPAAERLVDRVGRIAEDQQAKGERVRAHGIIRGTSVREGGFWCGPSTPVDIRFEVTIDAG